MAEQTMEETWRWKNATLLLSWWSPTAACYPFETKFNWIWVRILGLPLHLWSSEIMKAIGEKCGGCIETEEETQLRNHMRWARIKVKGPAEKIPRVVEVKEGGMLFSLPLWSEIPTTVKVFQEDAVVEVRPKFCDDKVTGPTFIKERSRHVGSVTGPFNSKVDRCIPCALERGNCSNEIRVNTKVGRTQEKPKTLQKIKDPDSRKLADEKSPSSIMDSCGANLARPKTYVSQNFGPDVISEELNRDSNLPQQMERPDLLFLEIEACKHREVYLIEQIEKSAAARLFLSQLEDDGSHTDHDMQGGEIEGEDQILENLNQQQLIEYRDADASEIEDVDPIQVQFQEAEMEATLWVHRNILRLSKEYGVCSKAVKGRLYLFL
uniref:Uncharacterized protein LOC104212207 n=1 Tax=Nicotiana sylvestris TaxID=4096 RepID=A0A1U7VD21_NICSY|nr:PREDICTED: uncharacterized protein LOC104212207 [Nicotiana sylvestris]